MAFNVLASVLHTHIHTYMPPQTFNYQNLTISLFSDKKTEAQGAKWLVQGQRAGKRESEVYTQAVWLWDHPFAHYTVLLFTASQYSQWFQATKTLVPALGRRLHGGRRMKVASFLPQSPSPDPYCISRWKIHVSPHPDFLLLEMLLCCFCIPATHALCMSLFQSVSHWYTLMLSLWEK